jgi:FMN phosphatase YigB (HAD superfamily)
VARVRAVLFDVGETLLDETRMWSWWADRLGVPHFTFHALVGEALTRGEHPWSVVVRLGGALDPEEAANDLGDDAERFEPRDLYPDAVATLTRLRAVGYRIGVGGNQSARREDQVRRLGLPADAVVCSSSVGVEKPSPDFFTRAAAALGVDPRELLSVGDRLDNDVLPALEAGCRAALLRRGPWGILHAERPEARRADLVLDDLGSLRGLIVDL